MREAVDGCLCPIARHRPVQSTQVLGGVPPWMRCFTTIVPTTRKRSMKFKIETATLLVLRGASALPTRCCLGGGHSQGVHVDRGGISVYPDRGRLRIYALP